MGWLFTQGASRKDIIRDVTATSISKDKDGRTHVYETLKQCSVGYRNLWTVQSHSIDGVEVARFICLYLLQNGGGYGWGYKDIDESMGPVEVNCPLGYLDVAGTDHLTGYAEEWRAGVRAYHAHRKASREAKKKTGVTRVWRSAHA